MHLLKSDAQKSNAEPIDNNQHRMIWRVLPYYYFAGGMDMPQRMMDQGTEGRLPSMAPLANPYVPFQIENPPVYEARKGIVRGTLFPGLDLPFM